MTALSPLERRAQTIERLEKETFDLLVVGAGIIGSRVAYEAACRGLRVALVDAGDFGGGTSSASSKLIHGGLRYLAGYDFGLVHEALAERHALLTRVAPHLVHRLQFLLPLYRGGPWSPLTIGAGLVLYSALSAFRDGRVRLVTPAGARGIVTPLRDDGLRAAGVFSDAQTDDVRLCLATVTAASRAGAAVLNHAAVVGIDRPAVRSASLRVRGGPDVTIRCRQIVNAAGPWVDEVRRLEDASARPLVRLSKGVHLTVPLPEAFESALIVPVDRTRVTFAIPWQGLLLLGTTDTPYDGDPTALAVEPADVRTVLAEAGLALPSRLLDPRHIRFSFAGLRALPLGERGTAQASREHLVEVSRAGMISVAGGKLTTHRRIALDVLRRLPAEVLRGPRPRTPDDHPLPGGVTASRAGPSAVDPVTRHLAGIYGSEADRVLACAASDRTAMERIHPEGPDLWAQARYAIQEEWAATVDDLVRRRTSLSVRGLADEQVRRRLHDLLASAGALLP
ncbi:MAG TPA: glycerol-3-phosphate dehydrogenase/oxidase [Candidatus Limnocylindrales bacterium]|nr:glycerol-3-phosphate dehydrogenase/oxidase [Candidatus Limnocylindrales bacterium]